ncbi:Cell division protein FtsI [Peptidoglycan synthetase] [hydrothermal vent metagenome]|uniref:Cell division protein FtsI [Peptidoglycan synthetase] n=1 Tax=hydrothermal vent metagenome TaxID=652676 RepID=A0A3B1D9K5_9ZZZZ
MKRRPLIIATVIAVGFLIIFARLAELMLFDHEKLLRLATIQHTKGQKILVRRGGIYDRRGRELAVSLDRFSLYGDPSMIDSPDYVARKLSKVIKTKTSILRNKLKEEKKRYVSLARRVSPEQAVAALRLKLKGIGVEPDSERFYPKGFLASHVLGFIDIDNRGREGVEKRYDSSLAADGGKVYLARDARGNILYRGNKYESVGNSIVLTIDEGLQYIVESELDSAVKKWKSQSATAIMMDPHTGEILALANRPTFDPNSPGVYRAANRRNRAITDLYEPGSTFKIVMAAAALEEKIATLNTRVDCSEGEIEVGGKKIRDTHKHGILTLREIIQKSSNVGAVKMTLKLGPERFYKYAKVFGFGERTGIDLTGEVSGVVKPPHRWSGTTIGAMAIGYEVLVSPLQVLRAYSVIANGGYLVKPYVVAKTLAPDGRVLQQENRPELVRVISGETVKRLREAFVTVTEEGGTAPRASVYGNTVAGKTGTSRMIDPRTGRYSRRDFVSSFVGFVPADDPLFAIIVVIWKPRGEYYGGQVAAPVFRAIAEKALTYRFIPMEDRGDNNILVMGQPVRGGRESQDF